jgi:hypothetical protein
MIDQYVRELAYNKMRFTASYIPKMIEVDIDFVKIMVNNDGLLVIFSNKVYYDNEMRKKREKKYVK